MEHQQTHYQVSSYICNQFMGVLKVLRHVVCKLNLKNHLAYVIQSVKSQIQTDAFVATSLHSMNSMQAIPLLIVNQL
jgi:Na+/glutamate symporter